MAALAPPIASPRQNEVTFWIALVYTVVLDCTIIYILLDCTLIYICVGLYNYIQLCWTVQLYIFCWSVHLYTFVLDCTIIYSCVGLYNYVHSVGYWKHNGNISPANHCFTKMIPAPCHVRIITHRLLSASNQVSWYRALGPRYLCLSHSPNELSADTINTENLSAERRKEEPDACKQLSLLTSRLTCTHLPACNIYFPKVYYRVLFPSNVRVPNWQLFKLRHQATAWIPFLTPSIKSSSISPIRPIME